MLKIAAFIFAALTFLAVTTAGAVPAVAKEDSNDEQPSVVQMSMLVPAERISAQSPISRLFGLSWADCGGPSTWVKIRSVSVQPDPIRLTGKITVAFSATVAHSFGDTQPLFASVIMKKKVLGFWAKLPCINNLGSCDYPNLCTARPPPSSCPAEFVKAGVPCKCPFPAGNYTLPSYSFTVDASQIPKFLESGEYEIGVIGTAGANQVLCANLQFSLD